MLSHFSCVWLCATPEMAAHQAPLSMGFSRQEHWSGLPFPPPMHESEKWKWSHSVVSNSSRPHGLQPTRLLRPWDSPGKSTGVGCHCLLPEGDMGYTITEPFKWLHSDTLSISSSVCILLDVLAGLDCYNKNTTVWVVYTTDNYFYYFQNLRSPRSRWGRR